MLIGIVGKAGAGKTTLAGIATKIDSQGRFLFEEYCMSTPLKRIAEIIGFNYQELYGSQADKLKINLELGVCSREFMQIFGSEIMCKDLPGRIKMNTPGGIWCTLARNHIKKTRGNIIISDIRFQNEADLVKECGGILIHITRNIIVKNQLQAVYDKKEKLHISEVEQDSIKCDYEIDNSVTHQELELKFNNIIKKMCQQS